MGPVDTALVLADHNGARFGTPEGGTTLMGIVQGRPLICVNIDTAHQAGITRFEIVLGYRAERVRAAINRHAPAGAKLRFTVNTDWQLEDGSSVLAASHRLPPRFAMVAGHRVLATNALRQLMLEPVLPGESLLAVDSRPPLRETASGATRVRLLGSRIIGIGMTLGEYDAVDTGVSACASSLLTAFRVARAAGDTSVSGGFRILAAMGLVRAVDVGAPHSLDVDREADPGAEARLHAGAHTDGWIDHHVEAK